MYFYLTKLAKEIKLDQFNEGQTSTSETNNEMVQLFHQLGNQQLANLLLKSKIESLKASLNGSSSGRNVTDITLDSTNTNNNSGMSYTYSPRSMPTTPTTSILTSDSMLNLLNKNGSSSKLSATDLNGHYLSKDDLALNHPSSTQKHAFSKASMANRTESLKKFLLSAHNNNTNSTSQREDFLDEDEEIMKHTKSEDPSKSLLADSLSKNNSLTIKKSKSLKTKLETKMLAKKYLSDSHSTNNGNGHAVNDEIGISGGATLASAKTPKSALLEKRRKAVFELLRHEIYPSGKHTLTLKKSNLFKYKCIPIKLHLFRFAQLIKKENSICFHFFY